MELATVAPLQGSLFGLCPTDTSPIVAPYADVVKRRWIDDWCWIDTAHRWFLGGDDLLATLVSTLEWTQRTRPMYDRLVREPRLTAIVERDDVRLGPIGTAVIEAIVDHYPGGFGRLGCNYYRDGQDSVAWHADRIARHEVNPLVVIVCLGGPRPFRLRPKGGGTSISYVLASGDVLVMGGATQHRWEHAVPKVAVAPPRISLTTRSLPRIGTPHQPAGSEVAPRRDYESQSTVTTSEYMGTLR